MASDITLSQGVRSNLLSLQTTAELLGRTQERLATGKKVNSALDNPINFFTSSGLSARANDLSRLLDSVGNGVQTINAADKGISAIKKLIESAQATARQALTAGEGTTTYSVAQTGTVAIADDVAAVTGTETFNAGDFTAETQAVLTLNTSTIAAMADGDSFSFEVNGQTYTFYNDEGADSTYTNPGEYEFDGTHANLYSVLNGLFGASGTVFQGAVTDNTTSITIATEAGDTNNFTNLVSDADVALSDTDYVAPSTLTINDGSGPATFTFVSSGASAAAGTFSDLTSLVAAINHANAGLDITASPDSGALRLVADNSTAAITLTGTGTVVADLGFGATPYTAVNSAYNSQVAGLTGQLTFQLGAQPVQTIEFGNGATGEITTRAALETRLADISTALGLTVSINGNDRIALSSTSSDNVTIGGAGATGVGLNANTYAPTATFTENSTRTSLQADFNNLLGQITTLAQDASYNGVNLLNGDDLTVIFNEDGSSSLSIQGVDFSASGLGLTNVSGSGFQTNAGVNAALAQLDTATATLRTQSSRFGSNLSIVQTRQDFTKNLISVLQTGADNLVLADTNEEGANMLALQTRQQLSSVALSMASQADQNVLRLF